MDIYTDVTKELKQREFDNLQEKMNQKNTGENREGTLMWQGKTKIGKKAEMAFFLLYLWRFLIIIKKNQ